MDDWKWLASTRELQGNVYGYDLMGMEYCVRHDQVTTRETDYLNWNVTAAMQELAEVREEFSWKPWATDAPFVNRERMLAEVVDVAHFLGNILVAMGVTDGEYERAYRQKQDLNRRRQASGSYSAQKGGLASGSDQDS